MSCKKLGSKSDAFQRRGRAWFCTTGLPSDIIIEVGEMSFHLHKFPLLSKSRRLEKLITEQQSMEEEEEEGGCSISLPDVPGDSRSFELVAKFCYGAKLEMNASNVVLLRCAAEHLQMTEEVAEGNLISQTEAFLNQVVLRSWKDSLKALQACEDLLPHAEELNIVKRCIESLAVKACTDPSLYGWPIQSPDGSVLWNGISTGTKPTSRCSDWWYDDVSSLRLSTFKRVMSLMGSRGIRPQLIAGSLAHYAERYIHGLQKRHNLTTAPAAPPAPEEEERELLEEIESLLPFQKGVASTKFLCGLLRTALILRARPACLSNLERRIGMQLDQATLEDLLMPTFSYSMETLYDVDCVQRILEHFLAMDQEAEAAEAAARASPVLANDEQFMGSPSLTPITAVAKLIDGYLAEVAPDVNLKLPKFQSLAAAVPEYARPLDDGLYRAIDIYLKGHPWLNEAEKEQLCRLMDCQKLSLEACTHAAQNERLPLRVVVQVLFFEQLQLRSSIAGCFLVSDNLDGSRTLRSGTVAPDEGACGSWTGAVRENQVLKVGMDHMRMRVSELEEECSTIRLQLEKLGQGKGGGWRRSVPKRLVFGFKSQMCSAREDSVGGGHHRSSGEKIDERLQAKLAKHKRN